jgi:hypothetical protein
MDGPDARDNSKDDPRLFMVVQFTQMGGLAM